MPICVWHTLTFSHTPAVPIYPIYCTETALCPLNAVTAQDMASLLHFCPQPGLLRDPRLFALYHHTIRKRVGFSPLGYKAQCKYTLFTLSGEMCGVNFKAILHLLCRAKGIFVPFRNSTPKHKKVWSGQHLWSEYNLEMKI